VSCGCDDDQQFSAIPISRIGTTAVRFENRDDWPTELSANRIITNLLTGYGQRTTSYFPSVGITVLGRHQPTLEASQQNIFFIG
jgi:hypothetical protein